MTLSLAGQGSYYRSLPEKLPGICPQAVGMVRPLQIWKQDAKLRRQLSRPLYMYKLKENTFVCSGRKDPEDSHAEIGRILQVRYRQLQQSRPACH